MATNRGVAYIKPGVVEVQSIPYPKLKMPKSETDPFGGKDAPHGVILKVVTTNICGSDQHMVRGRTTAPQGLILGHEITGEIIEKGSDVEMLNVGDLVTVPFNIACGRCRNCREGKTGICLTVNPARPGAAYGYVDMGGWVGGQAEYVLVPYADFNLIKFGQASEEILQRRMLPSFCVRVTQPPAWRPDSGNKRFRQPGRLATQPQARGLRHFGAALLDAEQSTVNIRQYLDSSRVASV